MTAPADGTRNAGSVMRQISCWQQRLSGRLRKKLTGFDQKITAFRQRKAL